ncbi:DNA-processing protein DprA [Hymenobacter sp. BT770]|uniref:DNA-processing protein DprA n=1 Tax=Hymenobacter sp. BT770 TaxID=2886942 RepID=UPI001D1152FE|nr:DNA-processing protein DprA [Hymenobacter sp. BT770]MCC3155538.1 DNA-processing protein DprA [Hymenobacter sp. BT770]MDO3417530.1 DNA-processing protein DprA [Hymenobacter sp. BT770]
MNDESLFHELALTLLPGIGPQLTRQLMSYGGAAKTVLTMPPGKLRRIPGVGDATVKIITGPERDTALRKAEAGIKKAEKDGVEILFYTSKRFPSRLKLIPDAPAILYYQGTADLNAPKTVALVGTRKATEYGREQTERIIQGLLPHRPLVVSGLAYGIDIMAHRSALQEGLDTVGVMATGLDIIYPAAHRKTAEKMREQGGLLTEFAFGTQPDRYNFPARNRIIAGLSDGTVVVEAAIKGGALITAELALSYDRDVLAVPGNLGSAASEGCNALIKNNKAALYSEPLDLEQLLNWDAALHQSGKFKPAPSYSADDFTAEEFALITVLAAANGREEQMDELAWKAQLPIHSVASLLLGLEFRGVVRALPGKKFLLL